LDQSSPIFKQALDDFIRVVGTYQGQYDTKLASFLDELQKTGIIDAVAESAIIGKENEKVERQFAIQHKLFIGGSGSPHELYKSIYIAFEVTFKELAKDRVIYHALTASYREIEERLAQITAILDAQHKRSDKQAHISFNEIEPYLGKIARGLQQSYKTVRIETNRGPRKVEINKVYVAPKLSSRQNRQQRRRINSFISSIQKERLEPPSLQDIIARDGRFRGPHSYDSLSTFAYTEIQGNFKRVVVLGDPGGGKSTLCQKVCFDLSKNASLALQFPDNDRIKAKDQRLPLRVILRSFEGAWVKDPQLDLFTFIERDLAHFAALDQEEIGTVLRYLLESGRAILAFDGLDEILDTSKRQELVDRVTAFCNKYPLCPVLVTSRLVGYDDAPLSDDFEELVLEKFDDEEILDYIYKFMKVVADLQPVESKSRSEKFLAQTATNAADLRRNPLMLGLMAWLFMASGDVPSNRPEIYKECSLLMFERWDQRRGILADENTDFERSQLFVDLASQIYGNPNLTGGVSRQWLEDTLKARFEAIYENKSKAFRATRKFVDFITGRAWVMSEVGEDTYTFTHQTFLEYFFATYLNDQYDSVGGLLRSLRRRIVKNEWSEVTHLALQIKTFRSLKKQEEALSILGTMVSESRVGKHQTALIGFVSRAMQYLSPSEHSLRTFLKKAYAVCLERALRGELAAMVALGESAHAASDRTDFIQQRLADLLVQTIKSGDERSVKAIAPYLLSFGSVRRRTAVGEFNLIHPGVWNVIRDKARADLLRNSDRSATAAGLAWGMYGHLSKSAFERFGIAPLYNFPFNTGITTIDGLLALTLQAGAWRHVAPGDVTPDVAEKRLTEISELLLTGRKFLRRDFDSKQFLDPAPMYIWNEIFQGLKRKPAALLGAILIRSLCSSLYRRRPASKSDMEGSRRLRSSSQIEKVELNLLPTLRLPPEQLIHVRNVITGKTTMLEEA
jgi:NACHT domain